MFFHKLIHLARFFYYFNSFRAFPTGGKFERNWNAALTRHKNNKRREKNKKKHRRSVSAVSSCEELILD